MVCKVGVLNKDLSGDKWAYKVQFTSSITAMLYS